jgi:hypothetical protein
MRIKLGMASISFGITALVILMAFYSPVSAGNYGVSTGAVSVQTYNQTDNMSIYGIEQIVSVLHPNWNYSQIYLSKSDLHNTSYGYSLTSSGNLLLNNTTYSYNFQVKQYNETSAPSAYSYLLLGNKTTTQISSSTTNTVQTDYNVSLNSMGYTVNGISTTNTTYGLYEKITDTSVTSYPPPLLPRVHTSTTSSSKEYYSNETFRTMNNATSVYTSFSGESGYGRGNLTIYSAPASYNKTANQDIIGENLSAGFLQGAYYNNSTPVSYTVQIQNNTANVTTGSDPTQISLDPEIHVGIKNNAVFVILEESITFGNTGMNSLEVAAIAAGELAILAAADISATISVALPSASALADASGLTVAASDAGAAAGSVSLSIGLGGAAAAVFAITDALETNDLINHPNGPSFTMYDEFGVDFTNTPAWEFWVWPPNVGFYGELGAEVGASYSGVGLNAYYPAITSYLLPKQHYSFMPYYQPPWY